MEEKLIAALYIRLSREDDKDGPSESVTNQRAMLEQYAADHALTIGGVYIDDGWSGCNFDRPDFQRMLEDIEAGKINMVITKDLSRLGRDYILTGHYLERYFPEHRVRYVSLLDGIDTHLDSFVNDITPFRAIMNDMYARDISRKITSVKRDKQRRGLFIGGKPMYGFRMHPTEKNHIVIDDYAADIVRRIFTMAQSGTSCRAIAAELNREKVLSPAAYAGFTSSGQWSGERISEMLRNEIYLGNMVQGRRVKASYKSRKSIRKNREDWIVVEHTHDPIIDHPTFDAVQRMLASRRHTRSRTYEFPLKGLVYCHECGHPMGVVNRRNTAGETQLYFICRTYQRDTKAKKCTSHSVKLNTITDLVVSSIRNNLAKELSAVALNPIATRILRELPHSRSVSSSSSLLGKQQQITDQIDHLCTDHLRNIIAPEDFQRLYGNLCHQRNLLSEQIRSLETEPPPQLPQADELVAQYLVQLENDRDLLTQLIERIELTEQRELFLYLRFAESSS